MQSYLVLMHLWADVHRTWNPTAHVHRVLRRARSLDECLKTLEVGEDCYRLEILPIPGDDE